jgi:hypothetical protein
MNMFRDGSEFDPQYDYFALDSVKSFGLEFNLHSESFFLVPDRFCDPILCQFIRCSGPSLKNGGIRIYEVSVRGNDLSGLLQSTFKTCFIVFPP